MKIELLFGVQKDGNGHLLDKADVDKRLALLKREAAQTFGGYTETVTRGGWINDAGILVEETGRKWEIYADDAQGFKYALLLAQTVRKTLFQNSVVLVRDGVSVVVE